MALPDLRLCMFLGRLLSLAPTAAIRSVCLLWQNLRQRGYICYSPLSIREASSPEFPTRCSRPPATKALACRNTMLWKETLSQALRKRKGSGSRVGTEGAGGRHGRVRRRTWTTEPAQARTHPSPVPGPSGSPQLSDSYPLMMQTKDFLQGRFRCCWPSLSGNQRRRP